MPLKISLLVGLGAVAYFAVPNYRGWLALGPGGPPYNIIGYAFQALAQPISLRNTTATKNLLNERDDHLYPARPRESHMQTPLRQRPGERPLVPSYVAPQRQMTQKSDENMAAKMNARLQKMVAVSDSLYMKPSQLESPDYHAAWIKDPTAHLKRIKGEFVHVHPDGSSHVVLSPKDAQTVIDLGWGELHKLSGVMGILPATYTMLYAPRDDAEFETWAAIIQGSVNFQTQRVQKATR